MLAHFRSEYKNRLSHQQRSVEPGASAIYPPVKRSGVEPLITQVLECMASAGALSIVVAAALSRSLWKPATLGIVPRILLAAGPVYLATNYLFYEDAAIAACSAATFVFCLYILRGWWVPDRGLNAIRLGLHHDAAEMQSMFADLTAGAYTMLLIGKRAALAARNALRFRVLGDVQGSIWLNTVPAREGRNLRPIKSGDRINKAAPDSEQAGVASTSISLIITQAQKAKLRECGFADEQIRNMLPAEAHKILGLDSKSPPR
jgi:hypothetical protein